MASLGIASIGLITAVALAIILNRPSEGVTEGSTARAIKSLDRVETHRAEIQRGEHKERFDTALIHWAEEASKMGECVRLSDPEQPTNEMMAKGIPFINRYIVCALFPEEPDPVLSELAAKLTADHRVISAETFGWSTRS